MKNLVHKLNNLALAGLVMMYDADTGLFPLKYKKVGNEIFKEGDSIRYSLICLLGLTKAEAAGKHCAIDIHRSFQRLLARGELVQDVGDLGLFLWLASMLLPSEVQRIYRDLRVGDRFEGYLHNPQNKTTELAWCLTALSNTFIASGNTLYLDLAEKFFKKLTENYGFKGIFGHGNNGGLSGKIRGRIGCFADQVYPIYALSRFYAACGSGIALKIATQCGGKICELQGDLGQWWWHYDYQTGKVVGRYPVYSVHQDGMAPMALFELQKVSGTDYSRAIFKGLQWLLGKNELGKIMVDNNASLIWRNIHRKESAKYLELCAAAVFKRTLTVQPEDLKVLEECWSYHLGWLLYAFSDKADLAIEDVKFDAAG